MKVHHITPLTKDKNFGKAINDIVRHLPDEDWICLRDYDTIPMTPIKDYIEIIDSILNDPKNEQYGVIGAMTNRQGLSWLCHDGRISDEADINKHLEIGRWRRDKHGSEVILSHGNSGVAGTFMLFRKKTWKEVGGFKEGGICIDGKMLDYIFCMDVKLTGKRMGVATGLYIFHLYRWGTINPMSKTNHLL